MLETETGRDIPVYSHIGILRLPNKVFEGSSSSRLAVAMPFKISGDVVFPNKEEGSKSKVILLEAWFKKSGDSVLLLLLL
ncbi:hypothetical protein WICPIJ_000949 [Wickerhamomyces pijperi]|uniref:Uncharacterized protein n=1 Tax=Wickerhamomyces pijperi TaxID=599730 RepID=A0A9P8TRV5_WICPI|nr:hypothetical protein WICPIJ_000949 [Wickerhamomyces pijperi]